MWDNTENVGCICHQAHWKMSPGTTKTRKKYSVEFIVVEQDYTPLLGKTTSEGMGYITVHYENISAVSDIPAKYDEVFKEEVGNLPGEVHLTIDQNAATQ